MMEHYGVPNPLMSPEIREKAKSYFLSHYGVEYYTQSDEYHRSARKLYKYDDLSFDSSWEVAMYIYYKAKGVSIQCCPVALKYQYNDTFHYYLPDFSIDGQLVEIKGSQLLDEDYRLKDLYQQGHHFIEAKYKCMCDNNV